jgi:hypothetical protein
VDVSVVRSEYLARRIDGHELWAAPMLAGPLRRVGDVTCELATWSPDGTSIACVHHDNDLLVLGADGGGKRKLASFARPPGIPRWSPDGSLLRFAVSDARDREVFRSLWQIRADGTDLHPLLPGWNEFPDECCG